MKIMSGTCLAMVFLLAQFGGAQDRDKRSNDEIKKLQKQVERLSNALKKLSQSVEELKRQGGNRPRSGGKEKRVRPAPEPDRRRNMPERGEHGRYFHLRIPEEGRKFVERLRGYIPEEGRKYFEKYIKPGRGEREERREFRFSIPEWRWEFGQDFFRNFDFERMMPGCRKCPYGGKQWEFDTPRGKLRIILTPQGRDRGHEEHHKAKPHGRKGKREHRGACPHDDERPRIEKRKIEWRMEHDEDDDDD